MNLSHLIINFASSAIVNYQFTPPPIIVPPLQPQGEEHRALYPSKKVVAHSYGLLTSWYGSDFHGRETANGEIFNQYDLTAAHPSLPFGTLLEVYYKGNSVVVRINDRGPYSGDRDLDLSMAAAEQLGIIDAGLVYVTVSELN